jgi:hypothetical protein
VLGRGDVLLNGDVVAYAAEFSLEADPLGVVGRRGSRVEGRAALGVGIVVVVLGG